MVDEVDDNDVVRVGGCGGGCGGGEGVRGSEVGSEIVEGERSEVAAVEGVGVEVEDGFVDGGGDDCDDRFRRAVPTMMRLKLTGSMGG